MSELASFRDVIELWPSKEGMASDIKASLGETSVPPPSASAVSKWWQRDNIPSEWWKPILSTGIASAAGLSAETLAGLSARFERRELVEARA